MPDEITLLTEEIARCEVCKIHLGHPPRPVVQLGSDARIVIIGQAPGSKVHESGIPWSDDSGNRLREWTGIGYETFYNRNKIALLPMGFCYPGKGNNADLPPRPECAPLWHERALSCLSSRKLTLLVGIHAQAYYLKDNSFDSMTQTVKGFSRFGPGIFPLPHPSWRSTGWMKRNPWFETETLPALRKSIAAALSE